MGFHFSTLHTKDSAAIFNLLALEMVNWGDTKEDKHSNFLKQFTKMSGFVKNKGHQNLFFNDCP